MFKKVIMKLSGNVRWLAGLVFERDLTEDGRSFDFIPHYNVTLTTPEQAKNSDGKVCHMPPPSSTPTLTSVTVRRLPRFP